jgi:hypothetical protein
MTKNDHLLHEKRKITFQELGALIATRYMLASGLLVHDTSYRQLIVDDHKHKFNMGCVGYAHHCGTIGCIGGNMAFIMGLEPDDYVSSIRQGTPRGHSKALGPLFYPSREGTSIAGSYNTITATEAILAIDNFLNTGKPKWYAVLGL